MLTYNATLVSGVQQCFNFSKPYAVLTTQCYYNSIDNVPYAVPFIPVTYSIKGFIFLMVTACLEIGRGGRVQQLEEVIMELGCSPCPCPWPGTLSLRLAKWHLYV